MLSMWRSLFGSAQLTNASQYHNNTLQNMTAQQMAAQQMAVYSSMHRAAPICRWMYDGEPCTAQRFAELMWPDDSEARLLFLLKYPAE